MTSEDSYGVTGSVSRALIIYRSGIAWRPDNIPISGAISLRSSRSWASIQGNLMGIRPRYDRVRRRNEIATSGYINRLSCDIAGPVRTRRRKHRRIYTCGREIKPATLKITIESEARS
jgi:hypothetical protein